MRNAQDTEIRSISIEEWIRLSASGAAVPVHILLMGESMRPLIRRGRDPVTIVPLTRPLLRGDVVLFHSADGRYVVHRVYRLMNGTVQTLGDNCYSPDPPVSENAVLGQVIQFQRGNVTHALDTPFSRAWGRCWMLLLPLRRGIYRCRRLAGKIRRKMGL